MEFRWKLAETSYTLSVAREDEGFVVKIGEDEFRVRAERISPNVLALNFGAKRVLCYTAKDAKTRHVALGGKVFTVEEAEAVSRRGKGAGASGRDDGLVTTPMPGKLIHYLVKEGDAVEEGQALVAVEAMKMENVIRAAASGKVGKLCFSPGDAVAPGDALLEWGKA